MIVALLDGLPVAVSKITLQSPDQAWLAGARVHPAYRGRGVASHMLEYTLRWLDERSVSVSRFATASVNTPVHQMADRFGFHRVTSVRSLACPLEEGEPPQKPRPLLPQQEESLWKTFRHSRFLQGTRRLFGVGWTWHPFTKERLRKHLQEGEVLTWGNEQDAIAIVVDNPSPNRVRRVSILIGNREAGLAMVQALRFVPYLVVKDPDHPPQLRLVVPEEMTDLDWIAERAGLTKRHDFDMWLFERDIHRKVDA
jgi:hypothetical protein